MEGERGKKETGWLAGPTRDTPAIYNGLNMGTVKGEGLAAC